MKYVLAVAIFLAGCCPHQEIRIEGSAEHGALIYDPNNDTLYWFDTEDWSVKKWPYWNRRT